MMPDEFDWAAHTKAVVVDIFGEPNTEMSRPPDDVRFGNHGSVSVNYTTGQWYDFENERGTTVEIKEVGSTKVEVPVEGLGGARNVKLEMPK